mmetsp:Transcript_53811/g.117738  ORF Transcript_53811/g.117738 Transcript_53811/m.117738 type:complete len:127 (-) Transcript_53811:1005-1385(-)
MSSSFALRKSPAASLAMPGYARLRWVPKVGNGIVVQNATHAAYFHLFWAPFAACSFLWLVVNATIAIILILAQQAYFSIFTPGWAPGVLNQVVSCIQGFVFAIPDEGHSMVDDCILITGIENSAFV